MPAKQPPTWTNDKRKLGDLKKWPDNPRYSTKDDAAAIVESYEDFGQTHLLLISPDNELYDGHQRLDSWLAKYGADFVVDVRVSSYRLSDRQRRKLVADLHIKATGQWNWDVLAGWGDDLKDWGFDKNTLKEWNNDANNLKEMLAASDGDGAGNDAEPQADRAAELQEKWQTATGQLWAIGEHRLLCGDSTRREDVERALAGAKADLGHHDPPYGVKRDKGFGGADGFNGEAKPIARRQYTDDWDGERPSKETFDLLMSFCANSIFWGGNFFADILPKSTHWIVWDKNQTMPTFGDCELAWTSSDRLSVKKYEITYNGLIGKEKERHHPTQKPESLFAAVIADYSADRSVIFDAYGGTGTTMVSCQNLGRVCRMVEREPKYVAVVLDRMSRAFPGIDIHLIE